MKLFTLPIKILLVIILENIFLAMCAENTITNTNTNTANLSNKNKSKEKVHVNSQIFLTTKLFKYKNVKKSNLKSTYTSTANSNLSNNNSAQAQIKTETNNQSSIKNKAMDPAITGPVLHEGWIKYFKYSDGVLNAPLPTGFEINTEFREQKKYFPDEKYTERNNDGTYDFIRDQNYFYLHLFENFISIISSKQVIEFFLFNNKTIFFSNFNQQSFIS